MATVVKSDRITTITPVSETAGPFNVGFRLFDVDAVRVYVDNEETLGFTLTASFLDGYDDNATITLNTPTASVIRIEGYMAADRQRDLVANDPNLTHHLNIELARHAAMLSEMQRETERSIRTTGAIPPFEPQGEKTVLVWEDGRITSGPMSDVVEGAEEWALAALAARDAARRSETAAGDSEEQTGLAAGAAMAALDKAQDWAEGMGEPGGPGTASAKAHAEQAAQDRDQTGLDVRQTGLDRQQTGLDAEATWQDKIDAETARGEAAGYANDALLIKQGLLADLIADALTLPSGQAATAVWDGDEQKITFGVPKGATGDTGAPGIDAEQAYQYAIRLPQANTTAQGFWRSGQGGAPDIGAGLDNEWVINPNEYVRAESTLGKYLYLLEQQVRALVVGRTYRFTVTARSVGQVAGSRLRGMVRFLDDNLSSVAGISPAEQPVINFTAADTFETTSVTWTVPPSAGQLTCH